MRDPTPRSDPRAHGHAFGDDWWRRGIVYQIYPRSFADSDGDGTGDLRGIIEHLDRLGPNGLGVDAIWLSPIYPSPGKDVGYDVSDHASIDPRFGTDADFDALVEAAHAAGLRVILDLVMNHTSDEHPWFVASRSSREGPFADWYLWRDPSGWDQDGRPLPPNGWVSFFGGPGWEWDATREQFYYHTFLVEQPELDWRTPGVEAAQFAMVQGWLDRGVDGFRLDVFNTFLKHPDLPSNPTRPGASAWDRQVHVFDRDQPDFPELIGRFRAILDAGPGRMSVGELFDGTVSTAADLTTERHLVFDWELVIAAWTAPALREALARREAAFGPDRWPTVVLSNHDQPRHASRLAASIGSDDQDAVAKAAAVLSLTVRGTPFLYYGEELGLGDVDVPPDERIDLAATRTEPGTTWWERSPSRTPMPWTGEPGAGFTTGVPWLRLGEDVARRNVTAELADPDSVLACYRRLIATRLAHPSLQDGELALLAGDHPTVVAFRRGTGEGAVVVAINTTDAPAAIAVASLGGEPLQALVGTHRDLPPAVPADGVLALRPLEACVLVPLEGG